jgi:uridine kinase
MRFSRMDYLLCKAVWGLGGEEKEKLFAATAARPLHQALFGAGERSWSILEARLETWPQLVSLLTIDSRHVWLRTMAPFAIWDFPFALAQWISTRQGKVFGFAGPPGAGKTTLIAVIVQCHKILRPEVQIASVSLDDFYFSKEQRRRLGFTWRAQPGTHDIAGAVSLLHAVQAEGELINIPRFDPGRDAPATCEAIEGPVAKLLMEGWFLGKRDCGYEEIADRLEFLIYIDCPIMLAKRRRFAREAALRNASQGSRGLAPEAMRRFWREVLEPGVANWVQPIRERADCVISLDTRGRIASVAKRGLG